MNINTQRAIAEAEAKGFVGVGEMRQITEEYRELIGRVAMTMGFSPRDLWSSIRNHSYTATDLRSWIQSTYFNLN